jgi:hypothetical protein
LLLEPKTIQLVLLLSVKATLRLDTPQRVGRAGVPSCPGALIQQQEFAALTLLQTLQLGPLSAVDGFLSIGLIACRHGWWRRALKVPQLGLARSVELL